MSLKTRLMLAILALPLLLLTILVGVGVTLDDHRHQAALRDHLLQATALLAPTLGRAWREGDAITLEATAARLLALEYVRAVSLRDADGTPRLELGRLRDAPPAGGGGEPTLDEFGRRWLLQAPLPGAPGARLILDIDASPLLLAYYRHLASGGLLLLVVGLLLFLVAYASTRRLLQPLEDVSRVLDRLALGTPPERLSPPPEAELGELARHANDLIDRLASAREDLEAQIEQATAELQESMETIEVQNIELDLAHRRALEANRAKSAFLANMSHEIRTPLNGIVGFCRLLQRSRLEARQREWLEHVQRACDNLLLLINDVLDFSKLEAGRLELERLPVDMVALVDEVLGLQAPLSQQKDLQLLGLVYDDVPEGLHGDPLRIRQVLTNLVNNAIKFTDRGEVIVRVMVEQAEPGRVTLRVGVSDTGIGLPPACARRLFQAFRQADASHQREFGGTGLGLAISRQLVERMGGEISVDSEPGQGSTFAFTLPLYDEGVERAPEMALQGIPIALHEPHPPTHRALRHLLSRWGARVIELDRVAATGETPSLVVVGLAAEDLDTERLAAWRTWLEALDCPALLLVNATPPELPHLPLPRGGEVLGKPLSRATLVEAVQCQLERPGLPAPDAVADAPAPLQLLVVDDTESNRLLLKELIGGPGFGVSLATSGEEALALARGRRFDMVLMDIRMAGMDGIETTRALRRLGGAWRHLPIIAVTAHVQEEQHRQLLASGLDDVLEKPLDTARLASLLRHHLGVDPAFDEAPAPPEREASRDDAELAEVDLALGTHLAGGREALARQLLDGLIDSLDDSEAEIRRAVEAGDTEALLDAIHALNGACRYCGVPRLGLLAETLETRLRSRGIAAVAPLLSDLNAAMTGLKAWQAIQPSSTTKATAKASSSVNDR